MNFSLLLAFCALASAQMDYIGGTNPNFIKNNPALITKFMEKLTGSVAEACKAIPAVGPSVLSIKQTIQGVDTLLDSSNTESYAKIILFKEFANKKTRQVLYKVIVWVKTFTSDVYIGAEMLYKPEGRPSFEVTSYILDSDLELVGKVLNE